RFSAYPHGDWRMYYFLFLLAFYLAFTKLSEFVLEKIMTRLTHGQGTLGGQV
ncbi:MAG: ABC transporter permease, partial [Planktomarina sp.]|nr:ABC transporter permease [Planktomarina sp.]